MKINIIRVAVLCAITVFIIICIFGKSHSERKREIRDSYMLESDTRSLLYEAIDKLSVLPKDLLSEGYVINYDVMDVAVVNGLMLDAWGRPMQLIKVNDRVWRVISVGEDGVLDTEDDIYYDLRVKPGAT